MKVLFLLLFISTTAYSKGGSFGAGIILGNLSGFSVNNFIAKDMSLDGAFAFDVDDKFELYGTFLKWMNDFAQIETVSLNFYYGIGAKYENHDDQDDFMLGVRAPVGIAHRLEVEPFEFAIELSGFYSLIEDTDFDLEFGVIGRYYF